MVFTTEPVLAIPDIDREMRVEADALDYAMGGVLSTKQSEITKFMIKRYWQLLGV